jgi:hypothetical protein
MNEDGFAGIVSPSGATLSTPTQSPPRTYPERAFLISVPAQRKLFDEARERGYNARAWFRVKARALLNAERPLYELTGAELNRAYSVGVSDGLYSRLIAEVSKLGLPTAVLGEMVCALDPEGLE